MVLWVGKQGEISCIYDSVAGIGDVLPYGEAVRVGQVVCESRIGGVLCRSDDGHGFTLSRQAYTLF
jgi:hypothetical protein